MRYLELLNRQCHFPDTNNEPQVILIFGL